MEVAKEPKKVGEGSYGCVYNPPLFSKSENKRTDPYQVSKIQEKNHETINEIKIGEKIQTVPNFSFYFAPLLKTQEITVSQMNETELDDCDVVQKNPNKKFVSNRMEYVGKNTLMEVVNHSLGKCVHNSQFTKKFLMNLVDIHKYLLYSAELLSNHGVLHCDIKSNNIMFHDQNKVYVVIDFGLGTLSETISWTNYKNTEGKPFGILVDSYIPWNIDILFLSYISRIIQPLEASGKQYVSRVENEKVWKEKVKPDNVSTMKSMVKKFLESNKVFQNKTIFTEKDLKTFEQNYHKLIASWKGKTWEEVWQQLERGKNTWDTYSINVMMMGFIENTNMDQFLKVDTKNIKKVEKLQETLPKTLRMAFTGSTGTLEPLHFFKQYILFIKQSILALPKERPTGNMCLQTIGPMFKKIPKVNYVMLENFLANSVTTSKNYEKTIKKQEDRTLQLILQENNIRKQANKVHSQ